MEIAHACQVQVEEFVNQDFDLMILGYKPIERSMFLLRNYHIRSARTLVVINTDDYNDNKKDHSELFLRSGMEEIKISSNDGDRLINYIDVLAKRLKQNELFSY